MSIRSVLPNVFRLLVARPYDDLSSVTCKVRFPRGPHVSVNCYVYYIVHIMITERRSNLKKKKSRLSLTTTVHSLSTMSFK